MNKNIVEQVARTETELAKSQKQLAQLEHQKDKIITRNSNAERKARSRNLIQRGAILESINPLFRSLSNEQLQSYLQRVLRTEGARKLLEEMVRANLT